MNIQVLKNRLSVLEELTPPSLKCGIGSCPAIFETDQDSYIIIGHKINSEIEEKLLPGRIGGDEIAIEVPKELIRSMQK